MRSTFVDYVVTDLLGEIEGIRARAMFGGHGIYQRDTMFGIIVDGALYFKAGDSNRGDYESAGSKPFAYRAKGNKRVVMSYWAVPLAVMDDRERFLEWVMKAIRASKSRRRTPPRRTSSRGERLGDEEARHQKA